MADLAERLASQGALPVDQEIPAALRAIADTEVGARRTRNAVLLHRAALLIEQQLESGLAGLPPIVDAP